MFFLSISFPSFNRSGLWNGNRTVILHPFGFLHIKNIFNIKESVSMCVCWLSKVYIPVVHPLCLHVNHPTPLFLSLSHHFLYDVMLSPKKQPPAYSRTNPNQIRCVFCCCCSYLLFLLWNSTSFLSFWYFFPLLFPLKKTWNIKVINKNELCWCLWKKNQRRSNLLDIHSETHLYHTYNICMITLAVYK